MASRVEDLLVYQKARDELSAISALIIRTDIRNDYRLRDQLKDAALGVTANIREGFGQQTDRQFVRYLYYARGSASEVRGHLEGALMFRYITKADLEPREAGYEEISKMLTGLIKYLQACDRKWRS